MSVFYFCLNGILVNYIEMMGDTERLLSVKYNTGICRI